MMPTASSVVEARKHEDRAANDDGPARPQRGHLTPEQVVGIFSIRVGARLDTGSMQAPVGIANQPDCCDGDRSEHELFGAGRAGCSDRRGQEDGNRAETDRLKGREGDRYRQHCGEVEDEQVRAEATLREDQQTDDEQVAKAGCVGHGFDRWPTTQQLGMHDEIGDGYQQDHADLNSQLRQWVGVPQRHEQPDEHE